MDIKTIGKISQAYDKARKDSDTTTILIVIHNPEGGISIVDLDICVSYQVDQYDYITFHKEDGDEGNHIFTDLGTAIISAECAAEYFNKPYRDFESRYVLLKEKDYKNTVVIKN